MSTLRTAASRANGAKSRGPVTPAGRLAALANSAKSTGPTTPEGKARSSQNAIRHGILAESMLLDGESVESFYELLRTLQEELEPTTSIESRFVETMAFAEWRRLRLICLEKEQFTIETERQELADLGNFDAPDNSNPGADSIPEAHEPPDVAPVPLIRYTALAFRVMSDASRAHQLLNRYESRYDREYHRALTGLRAFRADRRKDEKEARRAKRDKDKRRARGENDAQLVQPISAANQMSPKGEFPVLCEK